MKWHELEPFMESAISNANEQISYITDIAGKLEELMMTLLTRNPDECLELVAQNLLVINQLFEIEDPETVPPEVLARAEDISKRVENFVLLYAKLAGIFKAATIQENLRTTETMTTKTTTATKGTILH